MCGLVGMINTKRVKFDFTRFCTLGISNDSRGGDSVGLYIDGRSEYFCEGVSGATLFEDIAQKSVLLQKVKDYQYAFAHCRKASTGYSIDVKGAQPVVIKDENGEIDYVLMHNGTIYNAQDLAKQYIPHVKVADLTDSQIMANIFYHTGYDALAKYNGSAVFLILDYREDRDNPQFLCWKGKSKESSYINSGNEKDERPFYFVCDEEHFVMSSVSSFFNALYPGMTIYTLPPNTLCSWDGALWNVEEFSRKDQQQNKVYVSTYTPAPSYNQPAYNNTYSNDMVICSATDGKCYKGNLALHGMYNISDYGRFCSSCGYSANEMWFWNGTLLKNSSAYTFLCKFQKEMDATIFDIDTLYPELIKFLSPYPFIRCKNATGVNEIKEIKSPIGGVPYTGTVYYPFVKTQYDYINGIFQSSQPCTTVESLALYKEHKNDTLDYVVLGQFV